MRHANWFLSSGDEHPPYPRVFCFPHGGGNPRMFLDWQPGLIDTAEILAVCMPGRGHRLDEPRAASIAELADGAATAISEHADRPIYLFGHSLGGLVAFEVARRLRDTPAVRHLVVSGCAAPSLLPTEYLVWASQLEGRDFAEAAGKYEGLSPEIVADEELQELLLPDLRADVRLIAEYRYQPAPPLAIGLSLINGRDDWHVADGMLEPWRREAVTAPVCHWREGGHFYFENRPAAVVDVLRALVLQGSGDAVPTDQHVEVI